jgi:tetratricopeptide (TPR) repeat protein
MATSSKQVATRLDDRFGDSGQYYRFNVDQGLQDITLSDWEKSSTISAYTHNYVIKKQRTIKKFVDDLAGTIPGLEARVVTTALTIRNAAEGSQGRTQETAENPPRSISRTEAQLDEAGESECGHPYGLPATKSVTDPAMPCYYIPFPRNFRFVGRNNTLDTLYQMLFTTKCQKAAIVGLGGVGKTQVALSLAYRVKKHQPKCSVFWVPALSRATFDQAYSEIARRLPSQHISTDEDPKYSVRRYLSSEAAGPWLLVVDNADDVSTVFGSPGETDCLIENLPESEDGVILFTTRSREVAVSAAGRNVVELLEMEPTEATDYLEKSLIRRDEAGTAKLLEELMYLPLAITQAAAYLNTTGVPIEEYLRLLRGADQEAASLMSREFYDSTRYRGSQNAVATTWLVSFDQIRKSDSFAADLLSFLPYIEPKAIPQSILPLPEVEELMVHAIGTLCGYAFLTRRGDSRVFDMHSLVHLAARIWIQREGRTAITSEAATRRVSAVFPNDNYSNRGLWREYLPHAFRILEHGGKVDTKEKSNLCYWVGRCLRVDGRIRESVRYLEETLRWRKVHYEEDEPVRLASQHTLAVAYEANGQVQDAITLLEQAVAIRARSLAKDHPALLASQHELARAYKTNGQVQDAVTLLKQVVTIKAETFAEDHPALLASQHELAQAYQATGQIQDAVTLLEQVVAIEAKTIAEDHPWRLASQHELAVAYEANGQIQDAVTLLEHVVAIRSKSLAEDHPDRLRSEAWLTYMRRTYPSDESIGQG